MIMKRRNKLGNAEIKDFWGPYSEYKQTLLKEASDQKKTSTESVKVAASQPKKETPKKKLSFKEKFEFEQLEIEIPQLEQQKKTLEEKLQDPNLPFEELQKLSTELGALSDALDDKTMRWLELDELNS